MRKKCKFPEATTHLSMLKASEIMDCDTKGRNDLVAFILNYHDKRIIKSYNTELFGFSNFTFNQYKQLPYNEFYKLLDEQYSKVGLTMVKEGGQDLLESTFHVLMPIKTTSEDALLVSRKTKVWRIKDGDHYFDALYVQYEKQQDYLGLPVAFLPEFRSPYGNVLLDETKKLRASAIRHIVAHKKFPLKNSGDFDICEYVLEGKSDQYIVNELGLKNLQQLKDRKKQIARRCREFLTNKYSYEDIYNYFRCCRFF